MKKLGGWALMAVLLLVPAVAMAQSVAADCSRCSCAECPGCPDCPGGR